MQKTKSYPTILLTGAHGMIGSRLLPLLQTWSTVVAPDRLTLDITNEKQVDETIRTIHPDIIVHAAAMVDLSTAERERGDKTGVTWKTNVLGTKYLCEASRNIGAYVIYLSTGSVFAGTTQYPGPFSEHDKISPEKDLSWYGWTKAQGERFVTDSIIRLSRPIGGNMNHDNTQRDYLEKMMDLYTIGELFPLFPDQLFPLSYIPDIALTISLCVEKKMRGIFHIATEDSVSPLELVRYACSLHGRDTSNLAVLPFQQFIQHQQLPLRFSQYCAISGKESREALVLPKRTWKEVVDLSSC